MKNRKNYLSLLVLSISIFIPNVLCINKKQNKMHNQNNSLNLRRSVNLSTSKRSKISSRPKADKTVNCLNIKHKHNRAYNSTNFRTNQNSRSLKSGLTRLSKGVSLAAGGAIALASIPVFLLTGFAASYACSFYISQVGAMLAPVVIGVVVFGGAALLASSCIMYGLDN